MVTQGSISTIVQFVKEHIGQQRSLFVGVFLCNILLAFVGILLSLSIGGYYQSAMGRGAAKTYWLSGLPLHGLDATGWLLWLGALVLAYALLTYTNWYWRGLFGERVVRRIREALFASQLAQSVSAFESKVPGKYLLRYSGDLSAVQSFITKGVIGFVADAVLVLVVLVFLSNLTPEYVVVYSLVVLVAVGIIRLLSSRLRGVVSNRRSQRSVMLGFVANRFFAYKTIKALNRASREGAEFEKRSGKLFVAGKQYFRLTALIRAVQQAAVYIGIALVLWYSHTYPQYPEVVIMAFVLMVLYIRNAVGRMLNVVSIWETGGLSILKLRAILDLPHEPRTETPPPKKEVLGQLTIQNLYLDTPQGDIANLSFHVKRETVLLDDPRTPTLFSSLLALHPIQQGELSIDDMAYQTLTPFGVRRLIAPVGLDYPILGNTLFKAISYYTSAEHRSKAEKILAELGFSTEILDIKLTDYGQNLPRSDRMMLIFARALLTQKPILLLDQFFPNLHTQHQEIAAQIINQLHGKKTILIAQQPTPKNLLLDRIITL